MPLSEFRANDEMLMFIMLIVMVNSEEGQRLIEEAYVRFMREGYFE